MSESSSKLRCLVRIRAKIGNCVILVGTNGEIINSLIASYSSTLVQLILLILPRFPPILLVLLMLSLLLMFLVVFLVVVIVIDIKELPPVLHFR